MKKTIIVILAVIILVPALWAGYSFARKPPTALMMEIPSNMERNNPVPMIKQWESDGKSYYYFNWGVKPTAGYRLEYKGFVKNVMIIKTLAPDPKQMVAQVETYPKLLLVLPKGRYRYKVVDGKGHETISGFKPKRSPLKLSLWLPADGREMTRTVWRDPYLRNEGRTTAQIALEALFAQPEMDPYLRKGVGLLGVSFKEKSWMILMNKGYETLRTQERALLQKSIEKTVKSVGAKGPTGVEIVTDPGLLPVLNH